MITTKSKHTCGLPWGLPPCGLVCRCVGGLFPEVPAITGLMVLVIGCVGVHVCVLLVGGGCPLRFDGVGGVLVVC